MRHRLFVRLMRWFVGIDNIEPTITFHRRRPRIHIHIPAPPRR